MISSVVISKGAAKDLKKVPQHIADKFFGWVKAVRRDGLEATRKLTGYHDEPLAGELKGARSIRLSDSYRAYYRVEQGEVELVCVVSAVDKHLYRK